MQNQKSSDAVNAIQSGPCRPWISFLIGGGSHTGRTSMNLIMDGKAVRTASGQDRESLGIASWSVKESRQDGAALRLLLKQPVAIETGQALVVRPQIRS